VSGLGLLSGLLSTLRADSDPRRNEPGSEGQTYANYVEESPDFELLQSASGIDWILVDQVASPRRVVRLEILRLDYPERTRVLTLPLDPGLAIPMVSVVGPAQYETSVSLGADRHGPTTQFMFSDLVDVGIYRARRAFGEVTIVAKHRPMTADRKRPNSCGDTAGCTREERA